VSDPHNRHTPQDGPLGFSFNAAAHRPAPPRSTLAETVELEYQHLLASFPRRGKGAHLALFGAAVKGYKTGRVASQIEADLNAASCDRVPAGEVADAVRNAALSESAKPLSGYKPGYTPRPKRPRYVLPEKPKVSAERFGEIVATRPGATVATLLRNSPYPFGGESGGDLAANFMRALFDPTALVYCGTKYEKGEDQRACIKPAAEWAEIFKGRPPREIPPCVCVNPLDGVARRTKCDRKDTYRGDGNAAEYRFALLEFDGKQLDEQAAFFLAADLPLAMVVYSGGKSLHGWLRVRGVESEEGWNQKVKRDLFARDLEPLGADAACKTPAQLARLPGAWRPDKGRTQDLLYLDWDHGVRDGKCWMEGLV